MRIGIDIDDTLTSIKQDFETALEAYANSLEKEINKNINEYDNPKDGGAIFKKIYGFNEEELKYVFKNIQEEITNKAKPRKNAVKSIKNFHKKGHEIVIITARDDYFHDDPYLLSKTWLDKHNIYYDKLIVNARDKKEVCNEQNIDIFIDDNIYNCLTVQTLGIDVICFNENKEKEKLNSYTAWKDINKYIGGKY